MTRRKKILLFASLLALGTLGALIATDMASAHDRGGYGNWHKASYRHHGGHGPMGRQMGLHGGAKFGQQMERMFDEIDTNADGKVSVQEIDQHRAGKVSAHDSNGDGKMQLDEFQGLWLEHMRARMVDRFQYLDDDGDGNITDTELKITMSRMSRFLDRNEDGVISR